VRGGLALIPPLLCYQLLVLGLLGLLCMLHLAWPSRCPTAPQRPAEPLKPPHKHSKEPKPFAALTHQPLCAACEHGVPESVKAPSGPPPPRLVSIRGRPRQVATSSHCCPPPTWASRGWVGLGHLRGNGHPPGGPWRQGHGTSGGGYVLETHGTLWHGKRVSVELIVRVLACLAEGWGLRGTGLRGRPEHGAAVVG
jgi:hypothetical protein